MIREQMQIKLEEMAIRDFEDDPEEYKLEREKLDKK